MKQILRYKNKIRMEMKIMLLMKFLNLLFGGGMSGFHKLVQSSSNFFEHIQQQQISDSNRLSEPNTPFLISVTL